MQLPSKRACGTKRQGPVQAGVSARTRNANQEALIAFGNWCVDSKRLTSNPFKGMPKANEDADCRRQRRSMTEEELTKLLEVARGRPLLDRTTVRRGKRKGEAYARLRPTTIARLEWLGRERALTYKTQGNSLPLRDDLAADLRAWLADKLARLQAEALANGPPIPARLPGDAPLFCIPTGLVRILDRDIRTAGIAKRDERGRTLDVHALRTTFATLLSKGGVAPRTAQAAMRHADIRLTMQTYTDPKLLDVHGALDALPTLPLDGTAKQPAQATGTADFRRSPFAPPFEPTHGNSVQMRSIPVKSKSKERAAGAAFDVDGNCENTKQNTPLSACDRGVSSVGVIGFEPTTSWSRTKRSNPS